jgi:hypothetical protein
MTPAKIALSISSSSVIVVAQDQVACELAGEAVILNLRNGIYFGLDPVGARIWELIQTPLSVAEIRDALLAEYEVEATRCEQDLIALLEDMVQHDLIEIEHGSPS